MTKELASGIVPDDLEKQYRVIETGEQNCYLVDESILIDVGVPFYKVKDFVGALDMVLLTHKHSDHINFSTLKKIRRLRPSLPIYCGAYLKEYLSEKGVEDVITIHPGMMYESSGHTFLPFVAPHNVQNVGYFIKCSKSGKTVFHATDLSSLEGLSARAADIVALEFNHDITMMDELIAKDLQEKGFSHYMDSRYNHLSFQKARYFVDNFTKGEQYITLIKLHTSEYFTRYLKSA